MKNLKEQYERYFGALTEGNLSTIDKVYKNGEPKVKSLEDKIYELQQEKSKINKSYLKDLKKENLKIQKELESELKKIGSSAKVREMYGHTGAFVETNGKKFRVRFTGPLGSKIHGDGIKDVMLKPNFKISDLAKRIADLAK